MYCVLQAAADAGKPYLWTIDTTASAGVGSKQVSALVTVITRCLAPEAADRPTSAALVTTLTQMKAGLPVAVHPSQPVPPPALPVLPTGTVPSYDVLAIVDAMEAQGIDASVVSAVCNAIGHLCTSTLDILKTCGVPAREVFAVKRTMASSPAAAASTDRDGSGNQLNVLALYEAMEAMALPPSLQETIAELFGLQDSVTLTELRAAVDVVTLPGRELIRLRRALDPVCASVACVCLWSRPCAVRCVCACVRACVLVDRLPAGAGHFPVTRVALVGTSVCFRWHRRLSAVAVGSTSWL
jgi:hypothetical protein